MTLRNWTRRAALAASLAATAALLGAAAAPKSAGRANWVMTVRKTPEASYVMGNPAAPVKLVEYISYTCSHCAHFEVEAADQIKLGMVAQGKGSVEVRSFLRNPVDITASLLAQCGTPDRFFGNHNALLRSQDKWLSRAQTASPAQQQRWMSGPFAGRMRAIATDLGLYDVMATRGLNRQAADRCLANEPLAQLLATGTNEAAKLNVRGTPSFMINGKLQDNVHDWASLRPRLMELTR